MVLDKLTKTYVTYTTKENAFYRRFYHYFLYGLIVLMALMLIAIFVLLYQVRNRPIPPFNAIDPKGQRMELTAFNMPNMLPDTIMRFASEAAVAAYTFNFGQYEQQLQQVRPYFTDAGWSSFRAAISPVIDKIVQAQLFVNGVVVGTPVIANQGDLPGKGHVWRVQIPFLGSYSNGETETHSSFYVVVSIVKVPTSTNPQGMGIDQFVTSE